ncbi:MAG: hypothetical protein V1859_02680 [archaeon]
MGIQKDAGEILIFLYQKYVSDQLMEESGELFRLDKIYNEIPWDKSRIDRAVFYLMDECLIKYEATFGEKEYSHLPLYCIYRVSPEGIRVIEENKTFKRMFGFDVNLGIIKLSWMSEEK